MPTTREVLDDLTDRLNNFDEAYCRRQANLGHALANLTKRHNDKMYDLRHELKLLTLSLESTENVPPIPDPPGSISPEQTTL